MLTVGVTGKQGLLCVCQGLPQNLVLIKQMWGWSLLIILSSHYAVFQTYFGILEKYVLSKSKAKIEQT